MPLFLQGGPSLGTKIDIDVTRATPAAITAVEAHGGTVTCTHHSRVGLHKMLRPEQYTGRLVPRAALPPNKKLEEFLDPEKRGYLAKKAEAGLLKLPAYYLRVSAHLPLFCRIF